MVRNVINTDGERCGNSALVNGSGTERTKGGVARDSGPAGKVPSEGHPLCKLHLYLARPNVVYWGRTADCLGGAEERMELGIEILLEKQGGVMETPDLEEVDAIAAFRQREVEWPVDPQTPHALPLRQLKILLNMSKSEITNHDHSMRNLEISCRSHSAIEWFSRLFPEKKRLETRFMRSYNDVGQGPTMDLIGIIAMSDQVRQWTAKG
ncbi:UNVERIFIED_CONTAM: hypothetical protein FKN15_022171 [Acipenser sinensis]